MGCFNSRKHLWLKQFSAKLCPGGEIQLWRGALASQQQEADWCNLGVESSRLSCCSRNAFMQHSACVKLSIAGVAERLAELWCWEMQPEFRLLQCSAECDLLGRGELQIPGALAHYASSCVVVKCGLACSCWQWSVQTSSANALGSAQPRSVGKQLLTFHFFVVLTRFKNLQPTAVKTGWSEYKRPISSVWNGFSYRVMGISMQVGMMGTLS